MSSLPAAPLVIAEHSRCGTPLEEQVVGYFDQLREPLLRYLLSLGLTIADGEEIVQDVFLALFQHLQRDGSRSNLRGWLFRVAHNLGLKRRYRGIRTVDTVAPEPLADPASNPEARFLTWETHRRLQSVVQALPEQDRRCLTLRAEGLRYREIAAVLEISLGAVSLSLARSLGRLARVAER